MTFAYQAIDVSGKRVSGNLAVRSKAEAYRQLEAKSLTPVLVEMAAEGAAKAKGKKKAEAAAAVGPLTLKRPEVILFTEELADLLDAGVQLEQGLRILHERQANKNIKAIAGRLRDDIREGTKFSAALKKASPSFDDLYRNLVAAGEASGSLGEILRRLTENLKQLFNLQRRVTTAMIYPSFLIIGCIAALFVFSTILMPMLTELIQETGQEMGALSRFLIKFTGFMSTWWWLVLLIMVTAILSFRAWIGTAGGRLWWDSYKMRIPGFGPVISGRFYAQFCHTLSNLINNGIPLLNSLKLVTRGTSNVYLKNHLETAVLDVGEGAPLARTLEKADTFPAALIDRIAIGEQTGELGKAFSKAAARYDEDLDVRITRLTSLVPQIVIVIMAIVIGLVAYSIMTTIFGSMSGMRNRGGP